MQVLAQAAILWDGPKDELADAFAISEAVWVQHLPGNRSVRVMTEPQLREEVADLVVDTRSRSAVLGWASFIAATVFNRRDDVDANNRPQMRFGYYSPVRVDDGDSDYYDEAQETSPAPYAVDLISDHQWMKNQCAPGAKDRGSELDWMSFFYTLYAEYFGSNQRFSIDNFTSVMTHTAATGRRWDQVKNAAFASLSPEKYSRFTE